MDRGKKFDLVLLLVYPIVGTFLSFWLYANAFFSVIIFFGIPSVYLTVRDPRFAKRAFLFSLLAIPVIIVIDHIAHTTGQWIIPSSVLPRIFQYVTVEVVFWAVLNFYLVIMFYERFLHNHFTRKLYYPQIRYLVVLSLLSFVTFLYYYYFSPVSIRIPYFYLCFGVTLILIPVILQLFTHPRFLSKFFETTAYFFYLTLTYEITALQKGWWGFPGNQFIGWISIFDITFPLEELLFWLLLFSMAILTYYEAFDDNEL